MFLRDAANVAQGARFLKNYSFAARIYKRVPDGKPLPNEKQLTTG